MSSRRSMKKSRSFDRSRRRSRSTVMRLRGAMSPRKKPYVSLSLPRTIAAITSVLLVLINVVCCLRSIVSNCKKSGTSAVRLSTISRSSRMPSPRLRYLESLALARSLSRARADADAWHHPEIDRRERATSTSTSERSRGDGTRRRGHSAGAIRVHARALSTPSPSARELGTTVLMILPSAAPPMLTLISLPLPRHRTRCEP